MNTAFRRFILSLSALVMSGLLPACRQLSPVERHFVRIPARFAGGRAAVERERVLTAWHKGKAADQGGVNPRTGFVAWQPSATRLSAAFSMQLLHLRAVPGRGDMLVIHRRHDPTYPEEDEGLVFLRQTGHSYQQVKMLPEHLPGPVVFQLVPHQQAAEAWQVLKRSGDIFTMKRVAVLQWNGSDLLARRVAAPVVTARRSWERDSARANGSAE